MLDMTKKQLELFKWLTERLQNIEKSSAELLYRETADEDYSFYAGKQDDPEVKAFLEEQRRPCTVYNQILPKINMLVGLAAQNKQAPTAVPVGKEDEALVEVINGVFAHFRSVLKMGRREIEAFEHAIKGGRSLLHFYLDKEDPFVPRLKSKVIQGRNFVLDPDCSEYDLSDAKYLFVSKWFSIDEAIALFSKRGIEDEATARQVDFGYPEYTPVFFNEAKDMIRLVEGWYRKTEKVIAFMNPFTGKSDWLPPKEWNRFVAALKEGIEINGRIAKSATPPVHVESYKQVTYYALFSPWGILEEGINPYKHGQFPYVFFGAYRDDNEGFWFGATTMMKDPQRTLNTLRRQLIHLLQKSPTGILMHEVGAILNIEEYETRSADPSYHMELAPNSIAKVGFTKQPAISPVYNQQDVNMVQSIKDSSGIQDTLLGIQTSSREPGVTVKMRQDAGFAVLYLLFDNFRESRLTAAKMMLSMIQQYMTTEMVVRIEGEKGIQLLEVNTQLNPQVAGFNDISAGEFDFRVTETMENSTVREAVAAILTDLSRNSPGVIPPDIIFDYLDLPFTVKQRLLSYMEQQRAAAEQARKDQLQLEMVKAGLKAETTLEVAKERSKQQEHSDARREQKAASKENKKEKGDGKRNGRTSGSGGAS